MRFKLVLFILFLVLIPSVLALDLFVRPKDASDNLQPNTAFTYWFVFSRNNNCTDIFLNHTESIVTDESGVAYVYIPTNNISDFAEVLCEYKDGSLRKVHNYSDLILRSLQARTVNATNITAERGWFDYIGDAWRKVIQGFFVNIQSDELNATNITAVTGIFANITATEYIEGQPLDGSLGSGVIWAGEVDAEGNVNTSHVEPMNITYPDMTVRLAKTDNTIVYCNITAANVTVPNNQHTVYYVDDTCTVQNTDMDTYIDTALSPGGLADIFNVVVIEDEVHLHKGVTVKNKETIKARKEHLYTDHLSIVNGLGITTGTFSEIVIAAGQYLYIRTLVDSSLLNSSIDGLHVTAHQDGVWNETNQTSLNLTHCDDGTDAVACATNVFRRYHVFAMGFTIDGHEHSHLHELLPLTTDTTYNFIGDCLNIEDNPISYTLPSFLTYSAVPLYAYCGKRDDTAWRDGLIDLRVGLVGYGATVDTSGFLLKDGSRALSSDWNFGDYTVYGRQINASWNGSVDYYTIIEIDSHILNNITGLNESVKGWVFNGSFYLATEIDTHIANNISGLNESVKLWVFNGSFYLTAEIDSHILNNITALNKSVKLWAYNGTLLMNGSAAKFVSLNVTGDATFDDNIFGRFIGSIERWWDKLWVKNATVERGNVTDILYKVTATDPYNTTSELDERYFTQIQIDNDTIVRSHNTSWVDGLIDARVVEAFLTAILNSVYAPITVLSGLDIVNQSMLDNSTIIRSHNYSWCADSVDNDTILRNGTDANFGKLKSGKLNVTVSSGGAATIGSSSNSATGDQAIAMGGGSGATASGLRSFAVGTGAKATQADTVAMGAGATASGLDSFAIGTITTAFGQWSTAIGLGTNASGDISTAMGGYTNASGATSTAMGWHTVASGYYSTAMGREIQAGANYVVAIGLDDMDGVNCNQANSMCIMGGNLGIGTTTPHHKLEVSGSGNVSNWNVSNDLNVGGDFNLNDKFNITASDGNTAMAGNLTIGGGLIYYNGSHIIIT